MASKELCVLVPCYNESENIPDLFTLSESLVALNPEIDFSFCFIENGSTDDTHRALEENRKLFGSKLRIHLMKIPRNLGLGFGLISGLKVFPHKNVCIIPADGKYEALEISKIIAVFAEINDSKMLVKGIRIFRNDPALIRFLSVLYTCWCNLLYRMKSKDINGLPKIFFNSFEPQQLDLLSHSACFDGSLLGLWHKSGGAIHEIPLKFTQNLDGTSSWNGKKIRISISMLREAFIRSKLILK